MTADNNLVLDLKLDAIVDNQIKDRSGNNFHGTAQGNPQVVDDSSFGKVLNFDGEKDYLTLPTMNIDYSQGFTLAAWIWFDRFRRYSAVAELSSDTKTNIILSNVDTDKPQISLRIKRDESPNSNITVSNALYTKKWIHIAVTVDTIKKDNKEYQGQGKFYINGKNIDTNLINLPLSLEYNKNFIGRGNRDPYFDGKIATISIYNKVLSLDEIIVQDHNLNDLMSITDNPIFAANLVQKGIGTFYQIVTLSQESFLADYISAFGNDQDLAIAAYQRAVQHITANQKRSPKINALFQLFKKHKLRF